MASEHISFILNTSGSPAYPDYSAPDQSSPVTSSTFEGARVLNIHDDTGSTIASRRFKSQGAANITGSVNMQAYPVGLVPWAFRSFLTDAAQTAGSPSGFKNNLLPDDTVIQLPHFTFQQQRSATVARNVRGAVLQKLTLSATGGEAVQAAMDFIAEDIGRISGTWSDGTNSNLSSVVSLAYDSPLPPPLRFHEGAILLQTDLTQVAVDGVTNEMTVTAGTTIATIETFQLEITLNVEGRFAIRSGAPTIAYTRHGIREIVLTAEIDWADLSTSFYDDMRAADDTIVQLNFVSESSGTYIMKIVLPRMVWPEDGAPFPQLDGQIMPKKQSLRLVSMENTTINYDIGVTFQTSDDLVP